MLAEITAGDVDALMDILREKDAQISNLEERLERIRERKAQPCQRCRHLKESLAGARRQNRKLDEKVALLKEALTEERMRVAAYEQFVNEKWGEARG